MSKKKPQIFTTVDDQNVRVPDSILADLEQQEMTESLLRKWVRGVLTEQNVMAVGMCFPFAAKKAEEWFDDHFEARKGRAPKRHPDLNNMDKFKVVHGKVTDQWQDPPKPIVHAWVEMGDLVFDDQTKMTKPDGVPKDVYYDMYQPEVIEEYSAEDAVVNCVMKGEGPWNKELVDIMQQRDAWMNEATQLPREYFSVVDNAISSSKFWEQPNSRDDIDYYETESGGVMGTPAAEELAIALQKSMEDVGLDMDVLVRSHDTDDLEGLSLHPKHPAWPNRWLIDASWYVSKERPGRNTIDLEIMTSEEEHDILSALNSAALVRHIAQTVRHELVHYSQMKKQAANKGLDDTGAFEEMLNDPSQVPKGGADDPEWQKKYLTSHIEIDAHAHDAAEELLAVYDDEQIKDILRGKVDMSDRKLPNAIRHYFEVLGANHDATHKFLSKLYTQVESMK